MSTFEDYKLQRDYLTAGGGVGLSAMTAFLLGAAQVRTGLSIQTLLPFLQDLETAGKQQWLTPNESCEVEFHVSLGHLGTAQELLHRLREGRDQDSGDIGRQEKTTFACDLCAQSDLNEPVIALCEDCSHVYHQRCAQAAIRQSMLCGGGEPILCPSGGCRARVEMPKLQALFAQEKLSVLMDSWGKPREPTSLIKVPCPNLRCKSWTHWLRSQFFSCGKCGHCFCLHCLSVVTTHPHVCGPHSLESVEIGEEFMRGRRFKVCEKCKYWCSIPATGTVTCRCGEDYCAKCVLVRDQCTCGKSFFDKLLIFTEDLSKRL